MALSGLIPLLILFIVVGVGGFIGYSLYTWSGELADRGRRKMEKKNVAFTKDGGLRVGVKELRDETYADKTQSVLVNVWNHASLPNYKSRLGWNSTQTTDLKNAAARPSASRHTSNTTSAKATTGSASAGLAKPALRGGRGTSPIPGGWE